MLFIAGYDDIYRIPSHSLQCRSSVSHATKGESTIHDVSENYDHLIINVTRRLVTANFPHIYNCDHRTKLGFCFFFIPCARIGRFQKFWDHWAFWDGGVVDTTETRYFPHVSSYRISSIWVKQFGHRQGES